MATIVTRAGKGSALTWTEGDANITNLNNAKIENVVEDTTPQLGGDLDVNGKSIVSVSNGNINLTPNGTGKVVVGSQLDATLLKSTQSSGDEGGQIDLALASTNTTLSGGVSIDVYQNKVRIFETGGTSRGAYIDLSAASAGVSSDLLAGGGGGLSDVVADTTPQLGGNLDVNGFALTSVSNGHIDLVPNGTGNIRLTPSTGKIILGSTDWPTTTPTSGQVLTAGAGGSLSWATASSGGISNVVEDTTPELGGNLDIKDFKIKSTGVNGYITFEAANTQFDELRMHSGYVYLGHTADTTSQLTIGTFANQSMLIGPNQGGYSYIQLTRNANGNINIVADGTGKVTSQSATTQLGKGDAAPTLTTNGAYGLTINTNNGTNSGSVAIAAGANGNISISPNGTGVVNVQTTANGASAFQVGYAGEFRLGDSDNSNYVGFKSPATVSANKVWTLPAADGTNGQVLSTNGSGALSWATAGGGGYPTAVFSFLSRAVEISSTDQRFTPTEVVDTAGIASISSTYNINLPAGTYIVSLEPRRGQSSSSNSNMNGYSLFNVSGTSNRADFIEIYGSTTSFIGTLNPSYKVITFATSASFYIGQPTSTASGYYFYNVTAPGALTFIKVA